jgi:tetratricopeptide (TPR) repeat protein
MTRKENEELRKELDRLKTTLEQLRARKQEVAGTPGETEAILKAEKATEEQLKKDMGPLQFEQFQKATEQLQFQKAMEQLQVEMQKLEAQREKLVVDLAQEIDRKRRAADMKVADIFWALREASPAPDSDAKAAYDAALAQYKVSTQTQELEDAMLSKGDAGLIAILRFEKVKLYRKLRMYDPAVQELRRIIEQNLDERVTEAARWTLVETLQEQKEKEAAIAELERLLATTGDARKKKDALYGIINLLGDDPESKVSAIERLIRQLQGEQPAVSVPKEMPVSRRRAIEPFGIPEAPAAGPTLELIRPVESVPAVPPIALSLPGPEAPVAPAGELPAAGSPLPQPESAAPVGQSGPRF